MRRELIIILLLALVPARNASAQSPDPIMNLLGSAPAEEISPYDVERLEDMLRHPLRLNYASESRLEESGLFSHYQAASLADYRRRHGDVLSLLELSAVDGFNQDFVDRIAPFISVEGRNTSGGLSYKSIANDISIRSSVRKGTPIAYGLKYKLTAGERFSAGLSLSRTSESRNAAPDSYSGYLEFRFRNRSGKILAGNFNARFGQGLALWNGMTPGSLTSAASFLRKPSGISVSSSFTDNYSIRGLAGDLRIGNLKMSAMAAVARNKDSLSILPALNLSLYLKNGQLSLTHYADLYPSPSSTGIPDMKTSADAAFCLRGTDIYAEIVCDWVSSATASLAGLTFQAGENLRFASMLRYYPSGFNAVRSAAARSTTRCSNEYASSFSMDFSGGKWMKINGVTGFGDKTKRHNGSLSLDCAYFPLPKSSDTEAKSIQFKAQAEWACMISGFFRTTLRFSERIRTWGEPFRTDLRADFSCLSGRFPANLRLNFLSCEGLSFLTYVEGGYKAPYISFWLRQGIFFIDNWNDRIYVYERDIPGFYNVPAYYGRGVWTAFTMNWKFAGWGRLNIRAAITSYPFMQEKKPGRAELKFQFVTSF